MQIGSLLNVWYFEFSFGKTLALPFHQNEREKRIGKLVRHSVGREIWQPCYLGVSFVHLKDLKLGTKQVIEL